MKRSCDLTSGHMTITERLCDITFGFTWLIHVSFTIHSLFSVLFSCSQIIGYISHYIISLGKSQCPFQKQLYSLTEKVVMPSKCLCKVFTSVCPSVFLCASTLLYYYMVVFKGLFVQLIKVSYQVYGLQKDPHALSFCGPSNPSAVVFCLSVCLSVSMSIQYQYLLMTVCLYMYVCLLWDCDMCLYVVYCREFRWLPYLLCMYIYHKCHVLHFISPTK